MNDYKLRTSNWKHTLDESIDKMNWIVDFKYSIEIFESEIYSNILFYRNLLEVPDIQEDLSFQTISKIKYILNKLQSYILDTTNKPLTARIIEEINNIYTTVLANSSSWFFEASLFNVLSGLSSSDVFLKDLEVTSITARNTIFTDAGNSNTWNSGYTTTLSNSSNWNKVDGVIPSKDSWYTAYTTVRQLSSVWLAPPPPPLGDMPTLTGRWNSLYTTVSSNSAEWLKDTQPDNTDIVASSGKWRSTLTQVIANSSNWTNKPYDLTAFYTGIENWNSAYSIFQTNNPQWDKRTVKYLGDTYQLSGKWNSTFTTVSANSGIWGEYATITANLPEYIKEWDGVTTTIAANSGSWSQLGGLKNIVTNGNFDIWQRGNTKNVDVSGYNPTLHKYAADRWESFIDFRSTDALKNQPAAYSVSKQQTNSVDLLYFNSNNFLRFNTQNLKNTNISSISDNNKIVLLRQRIEDIFIHLNKPITVSFRAKSSMPSAVLIVLEIISIGNREGTGNFRFTIPGYKVSNISTEWQNVFYTAQLPTISEVYADSKQLLSNVVVNQANMAIPKEWLLQVSVIGGLSDGENKFIKAGGLLPPQVITFLNNSTIKNGFYDFVNFQAEISSTQSFYEIRPAFVEYIACQRYYTKSYDINTPPGTRTFKGCISNNELVEAPVGSVNISNVKFPKTLRTAPLVSIYNPDIQDRPGYVWMSPKLLDTNTNVEAVAVDYRVSTEKINQIILDTNQLLSSDTMFACMSTVTPGSYYTVPSVTVKYHYTADAEFYDLQDYITTDIFAVFDTTSMTVADREAATLALIKWYNDIRQNFPIFIGRLFILPHWYEEWLNYPNQIYNKTGIPNILLPPPANSEDAFNRAQYRSFDLPYKPDWSTFPDKIRRFFLLAFVDETHSQYHGDLAPLRVPDFNNAGILQPTNRFKQDFSNFKNNYENNLTLFKGVLYPIVRNGPGQRNFLLHAMGAMEGRVLEPDELNTLYTVPPTNPAYTNLTAITSVNPYTSANLNNIDPPGVKNYGWGVQYNKTSPASSVFSSATFAQELNNLLIADAPTTQLE